MHGDGHMIYANKNEYKGQFLKNQIEGYGILSYPNIDYYEGYFKNNKKNGKGR